MNYGTKKIPLSRGQKKELEKIVRKLTSTQSMVLRAKIILMASEGVPVKDIQKALRTTRATIIKWKSRFLVDGFEGLNDSERPGQPLKYGENTREKIAFHAIHPGMNGKRKWTVRGLADFLNINRGIVQRVLQGNGIKLNNMKTYSK
jgi:transposase